MKHKTRFFIVMALILTSLTLALAPAAAQDESLLIWADTTRAPILTELAATFTDETGVPVEVQEIGMGEIRSNLPIAGPAGEGPDIIVAAHDWLGELVLNGSVVPLDLGDMADQFTATSLALFTYNDELYGMPYAVENVAFFRNPDLVPEAPETWEEVFEITEELVTSGAAEHGYIIQTSDAYHFFPLMSAFGGYVFGLDESGNFDPQDVGIDSEGTIAAGEFLQRLVDAGYLPAAIDYDVMHALFEGGDAAMMISGPWALSRIRESEIPYAISNIPAGPAGPGIPFIGAQGFMISAFSENQLLAEAFLLDYVATDEAMRALYQAGDRPPTLVSVLETLEDADLAAFAAAGENGIPLPAIPEMTSVWGAWQSAQQLVIQGELAPEQAFSDAAAQIRTLIAGGVVGSTESETGETATIAGTIQSQLGCPGDWMPECESTFLVAGEDDGVWMQNFDLEAGDYEYKVALNGTWDENYGTGGERDGGNIALSLSEPTTVTFLYDPVTHWVTDSVNSVIATAPGSYQAALGCPADWAPDCLLSWLQDPDGDGVYTFTMTAIPAGDYEVKVAINQSWDLNYGADAQRDGPNIPFNVPADGAEVTFSFDSSTNLLTVEVSGA